MTYFSNIRRGIKTTVKGLSLTLKHFFQARNTKGPINVQDNDYFKINQGYVTLQYPHENISMPDHGRNQLECEIDDCIVCDKCAKICPVNCIDIVAIKSSELIRTTSDGSPVRLYAEKFDIDMAKCCFCGLCTTVCPTDCLTMNNVFDYSTHDVDLLNFAFSNLSQAEAQEKRMLYDQFLEEKAKLKETVQPQENRSKEVNRPFIPTRKPIVSPKEVINNENVGSTPKEEIVQNALTENSEELKPKFIPKIKPLGQLDLSTAQKHTFIPKIKPQNVQTENIESKPVFIPKLKPQDEATKIEEKPKFIPKIKPQNQEVENLETKPAFVPKLKPQTEETIEVEKPKFTPKLKPKP